MTLRYGLWAPAIVVCLFVAGGAQDALSNEKTAHCKALNAADPDKDGALDSTEAREAASRLFDKLETDKDGTVTPKELQGRLSRKDLSAGDPDKDATLTKDEYLAIVGSRFTAADHDADGTVDCKEAKSDAGRALLRVLK